MPSAAILSPPSELIGQPAPASPAQRLQLMGAIMHLALHSRLHRHYSLQDLGERILASLHANQFRFYTLNGSPVGFVNWAWLDEATAQRLAGGNYNLTAQEWCCGPAAWIPELLAPFGHARPIVRDLRDNVFRKGTRVRAVRVGRDGRSTSVAQFTA